MNKLKVRIVGYGGNKVFYQILDIYNRWVQITLDGYDKFVSYMINNFPWLENAMPEFDDATAAICWLYEYGENGDETYTFEN